MDILMMIAVASLLVFVAMIISEKKRGLGALAVILSTCAVCGVVRDAAAIGDDWLLLLVPELFVLLMSLVTILRVGVE